ncbi:MAG TPA: hypothetical protein VHU19_16010 [Pyrinomonadaceae bacterium]|jgi:hypothetical protein|nr:hypothetical protein [Pyrinomonadaceae bacterium]
MNCQDFENGIDSLARGALVDTGTREEASAHAEACTRCALRLADERALNEGLRALASKLKTAEAPASVESALLAAMRARAAAEVITESERVSRVLGGNGARVRSTHAQGARHGNVSTLAERAVARHWSWPKTVAAAALAAAAALTLFMLIPPGMSVPAPGKSSEVNAATAGQDEQSIARKDAARTPPPFERATSMPDGEVSPPFTPARAGKEVGRQAWNEAGRSLRAPLFTRATNRAVAVEAKFGTVGARGGSESRRGHVEGESSEEIATDFIPLMQGGRFTQAEGGRLIRIELPRSALASFGLPVNAEAAGGRVKADVLLGDDGLARAIRFVR